MDYDTYDKLQGNLRADSISYVNSSTARTVYGVNTIAVGAGIIYREPSVVLLSIEGKTVELSTADAALLVGGIKKAIESCEKLDELEKEYRKSLEEEDAQTKP